MRVHARRVCLTLESRYSENRTRFTQRIIREAIREGNEVRIGGNNRPRVKVKEMGGERKLNRAEENSPLYLKRDLARARGTPR